VTPILQGAVATYDYSKLFSETGMEFTTKLLNLRELISRLPADVRASAKYWIKRIKKKAGTELLNNLDRVMKEEEEEGDGSIL
jgi:class 3 adenylate cyclase